MAALDNYIDITITVVQPGVSQEGFGTPLILSHNATFPERTRVYSDLDGVADDFAVTSPEYRAAGQMFAQSPHVPEVKIGRGALVPTLVYTIGVAAVRTLYTYRFHAEGQGVTSTDCAALSDGSPTNDEIATAIQTALNAVVGKNFTATLSGSVGSKVVVVTGDAAGNWFSISVDSVSDLSIAMTHADPGVATDLAAIKLADPDWYVLYTLYNSPALAEAASTWAESNGRAYWPDTNQSVAITAAVAGGAPDLADVINTTGVKYTLVTYHPKPHQFMGAAWIGRYFCTTPGKSIPALKPLSGVDAVTLSDTQRANLIAKRANSYERVSGTNVTFRGTVPSTTYRFFDVVRDVDKWANDAQTSGFGVLASQEKVQFTDDDVPLVTAAIRSANRRAEVNGIAAKGSSFVTAPLVAAVSASDKADRILPDIEAGFTLAGAVQSAQVRATITF